MSTFLWGVLPYLCIASLVGGTIWRYRYDKFGWTTRSSQLYESRLLRIGSPLFHFGILLVFFGHVGGLIIPESWTEALGVSEDLYHFNALFFGTIAGICTLVGILILMAAVEAIVVPLVALMFQAALFEHALLMLGLLAAGTVGFAAVGTLFAAMLVRARSRDVMLPVLLYPITVPVIIAGVRGTAALLQPEGGLAMARAWLSMLVFFDVMFITLALWTFEPVMTE